MTLKPAYGEEAGVATDTNDFVRVSEGTTNTQIPVGTPPAKNVVVNFDTVDKNTATGNFSLASEAIVVADAGEYRIEYMVSFVDSSATITLRGGIEIDPNTTSFAQADGSVQVTSGDADERQSLFGYVQVTLVSGSKVRLKVHRDLGDLATDVDRVYTHMSITRIRG